MTANIYLSVPIQMKELLGVGVYVPIVIALSCSLF